MEFEKLNYLINLDNIIYAVQSILAHVSFAKLGPIHNEGRCQISAYSNLSPPFSVGKTGPLDTLILQFKMWKDVFIVLYLQHTNCLSWERKMNGGWGVICPPYGISGLGRWLAFLFGPVICLHVREFWVPKLILAGQQVAAYIFQLFFRPGARNSSEGV